MKDPSVLVEHISLIIDNTQGTATGGDQVNYILVFCVQGDGIPVIHDLDEV